MLLAKQAAATVEHVTSVHRSMDAERARARRDLMLDDGTTLDMAAFEPRRDVWWRWVVYYTAVVLTGGVAALVAYWANIAQ